MENFLTYLPNNPLVAFTILLLVILTVPPIFEKLRLPGLVGLLVAGVVLGKDGLQLLDGNSESIELLEDIGKIYLMFVAGLEIDLEEFRRTKDRSLSFGFATFAVPMIFGIIVGRLFDFSWNTSVLIGSLFASHTLLGYPIVQQLGMVRNQAVMVTIGATIFTDISALLVLAICVSIHGGDFSLATLINQLVALGIYAVVVLFGFDWAGKLYFRRTGDEESNQFLFILLAVFLASVGAQMINVDKIVGAFLAGLAVNDVVGDGPVKEKVEFVGSTLFIPFFFVGMGLLLDVPTFMETIRSHFPLMLAIVVGLISAKFIAALITQFLYRYSWNEGMTMWSLSLPQVAATLAAALVAFQAKNAAGERLINEAVFNSVIVLMLVTSILGPLLTAQFAKKLTLPTTALDDERLLKEEKEAFERDRRFTVLVPLYNPYTHRHLISVAALLAHHESGVIVPLSIAKAYVHMDEPALNRALRHSRQLLNRAMRVSEKFGVEAKPKIRIDDDVAHGISRAAREENADLVVMGWSATTGLRARLFGTVIDSVFASSHCPVAVMRLLDDPANLQRILVPVKNITPQTVRTIEFSQLFADIYHSSVTFLHICDRGTTTAEMSAFEQELSKIVAQTGIAVDSEIQTIVNDHVAKVIIRTAQTYDLVVMRSIRRRTAGGLAVSDVTTEVIKAVMCSMVLFGEPNS